MPYAHVLRACHMCFCYTLSHDVSMCNVHAVGWPRVLYRWERRAHALRRCNIRWARCDVRWTHTLKCAGAIFICVYYALVRMRCLHVVRAFCRRMLYARVIRVYCVPTLCTYIKRAHYLSGQLFTQRRRYLPTSRNKNVTRVRYGHAIPAYSMFHCL